MEQTYYEKNKDKAKAYAKKYIQEHYEEHKRNMRKYVKTHKDKVVEYNKEYKKKQYHSDEYKKIKQLLKTYHSLFFNGKMNSFAQNVGLPLDEYKAHIESLLPEGYDWSNYKKKWRIGHINEELDVTTEDNIQKFFNYKNVKIDIRK